MGVALDAKVVELAPGHRRSLRGQFSGSNQAPENAQHLEVDEVGRMQLVGPLDAIQEILVERQLEEQVNESRSIDDDQRSSGPSSRSRRSASTAVPGGTPQSRRDARFSTSDIEGRQATLVTSRNRYSDSDRPAVAALARSDA